MAVLRWQYFVVVAALIATACHRTAAPPLETVQVVVPRADTTAVLAQLEYLGNIAYDHPEQFIQNPDSFISLLPALPTTSEGREMYAWLLLNIGYGLREAGNLLGSANYYEQAMDYCAQHQLAEPDFILYIAKPLGNLYTQIGDLQKSLYIHRQAITYSKRYGHENVLPALYTNLATVYQQVGYPDSLMRICREGLQYADHTPLNAALLYNIMAGAHQQLSSLDSARYYNGLAMEQFRSDQLTGDTLIWYANTLHQRAVLDVEQQQLANALRYLNQAIGLTEQSFPDSKQRERAKYYHARGSLYYKLKRDTDAIRDFKRALHLFDPAPASCYFPDYAFTETLLGLARTYAVIGDIDSTTSYYTKAIENAYYTQQLIVSNESHYQNSAWNRVLLHEAADHLWKVYTSEQDPSARQSLAETLFWLTELSKGRQLLQEINRTAQWADNDDQHERQRLQTLYQAIAQTTDSLEKHRLQLEVDQLAFDFQLAETHFNQSFAPPDARTFTQEIRTLSDSTLLISYFISATGDTYYTTCFHGYSAIYRVPADTLAGLSQFIDRYFRDGPANYDNDPQSYLRQATHHSSILLPPLGTDGGRRITISPDGQLFMLPFDALVHDHRFVGEQHTIHYTYTFLLHTPRYQTSTNHQPAISVFAKSHYDSKTGLRDLPAVDQEAAYLTQHFNASPFRNNDATDSTFFDALEKGNIIHLAAHAVADEVSTPYIVFNQPVTLDKLRYIRTTSPLVFLSACQTASGELLHGEGVESLNKAFLSKGVKGVVASYWPVDDRTTALLTELFYEALAETARPAAALVLAKRRYMAEAPQQARNPWYWASLQFTGIDTSIVLQPTGSGRFWLSIGLVLVAVVGGISWVIGRSTLRRPEHPLNGKKDKAK